MAPRTTCVRTPIGPRLSVATGKTQAAGVPLPEVGSILNSTAKTQDADEREPEARDAASGSEKKVISRSMVPKRWVAASEPSTSATDDGQGHGDDREEQRDRHLPPGRLHCRTLLPDGISEVALGGFHHEDAELLDQRPVEAVCAIERVDPLLSSLLAGRTGRRASPSSPPEKRP